MIIYPDEKVLKHKGISYEFDEDITQYCSKPDFSDEDNWPRYLDADILLNLVALVSGDKTLQETFISLKRVIAIRDQHRIVK